MPEKFSAELSIPQILLDLEPKPASYLSAARQIESYSGNNLQPVRVSVLSSFTADVLHPYIVTEGARRGMKVTLHFCPFNQIEIQVLNPKSDLYGSQPDVIIVAWRLEDVAPQLIWRYATLSTTQVETQLSGLRERVQHLLTQIRENSSAAVLVFNFGLPAFLDAGLADPLLELPQGSAIVHANQMLSEVCRKQSTAFVFDYARLVTEFGLARWFDRRLQYTARIPFSMNAQMAIGARLTRHMRALFHPPCKCLVVDLDNTLWGGVLGEDGLGGIKLDDDYPGNIYKDFQRRLISLRDQGILLAIASKNNQKEVLEVLEQHPDMLLRREDFVVAEIHWGDKVESLKAIATQLNIGLDALAFFDDSPVERALVRECLPDVNVIEVPANPLQYLDALEESVAFDRLVISAEDWRRADIVQQARNREQFRTEAETLEHFLQDLEMTAIIGGIGPPTLPRVVQLIGKTNQFNLTTRRHTGAQLQTIAENGGIILWMRVKDRFGDNGLVGVAIGIPEGTEEWRIDSLLLSCRVIGRRLETTLLSALAQSASERGCKVLVGEYIPTAKNSQVANFYESHGFQSKGCNCWALDLGSRQIEFPAFIKVHYEKEN